MKVHIQVLYLMDAKIIVFLKYQMYMKIKK